MNINEKVFGLIKYLKQKNSQEEIFCAGDSKKFEVGVGIKDQLLLYGTDVASSDQIWNKIQRFFNKFDLENIFGYIGYDIVHEKPYQSFSSSFPLVHLIIPKDVYEINSQGIYKNGEAVDFEIKKTLSASLNLITFDKDETNKKSYLGAVQNCLNWIGEQKERKLTICRKILFSKKINLSKSLSVKLPAESYFFYYFNKSLEFVGNSPERTLYRSKKDDFFVCEKASGTFQRDKNRVVDNKLRDTFSLDEKNLYEHKVGVDPVVKNLRKVSTISKIIRAIRDFSNLRHFITKIDFLPKKRRNLTQIIKSVFPKGTDDALGLELLRKNEDFSRGPYYGLFLSQLANGEIQAYHLIRSIFKDGEDCYSICGAGITCNSTPQDELNETRLKLSNIVANS